MWFSIGPLELGMVGVLFLIAATLAALRMQAWRWAAIILVSAIIATICTPPDPLSTILLGTVFTMFFIGGIRFGVQRSIKDSLQQRTA